MLWGSLKFNGPSQFLYEIPSEYYRWDFYQTNSNKNSSERSFEDFDQRPDYSEDVYHQDKVYQVKQSVPKTNSYESGVKIIHALYGEGTVLDSEGFGHDEKVTIQFRDGIRKKFMVKFAPLQKV
jgi:DNA helicase II / ATP-dependent DNA helicase PcrA